MTKKKPQRNKGQGNGAAAGEPKSEGVKGNDQPNAVAEALTDTGIHKNGETLVQLQQALHHGWDIPLEARKQLPEILLKMCVDKKSGCSDRERQRAANIVRMMLKDNVDAIGVIDKIQRLDLGLATDNVDTHITGDVRVEMRSAEGNEEMAALLTRLAELQSGIEPADASGNGHKKNGQNGKSNGSA